MQIVWDNTPAELWGLDVHDWLYNPDGPCVCECARCSCFVCNGLYVCFVFCFNLAPAAVASWLWAGGWTDNGPVKTTQSAHEWKVRVGDGTLMVSTVMRDTSKKNWRAAFFFQPLNQIRLITPSLTRSSKFKTKSLKLNFKAAFRGPTSI